MFRWRKCPRRRRFRVAKTLRNISVTMTMTMTHSYEVVNVNQQPAPTDMSAGVMNPHKKESDTFVRLAQRARKTLGTLFKTVHRVTREKKDHQAFAVTNSIEFKEASTSIHMCSRKKRKT